MDTTLRLLVLGAHPDDADSHAGGLIARYRKLGHTVKLVSVTNGAAGHHQIVADELAALRREEAAAAGRVVGAAYEVWDFPDAHLVNTLDLRHRIIAEIRQFAPDLVLTHRTCDYHPDHRALGEAVQDATFLLRVPKVVAEVPPLRTQPVVAFLPDIFNRPYPLSADVIVDVTNELDTIVAMLACHRSQMFEWLPWLDGRLDEVPGDEPGRQAWVRQWFARHLRMRLDRFRKEFEAAYGPCPGDRLCAIEVFEISQYGSPLDAAARKRLFPLAP
jgi:N-acetylglucosamine malate deacetylase 1